MAVSRWKGVQENIGRCKREKFNIDFGLFFWSEFGVFVASGRNGRRLISRNQSGLRVLTVSAPLRRGFPSESRGWLCVGGGLCETLRDFCLSSFGDERSFSKVLCHWFCTMVLADTPSLSIRWILISTAEIHWKGKRKQRTTKPAKTTRGVAKWKWISFSVILLRSWHYEHTSACSPPENNSIRIARYICICWKVLSENNVNEFIPRTNYMKIFIIDWNIHHRLTYVLKSTKIIYCMQKLRPRISNITNSSTSVTVWLFVTSKWKKNVWKSTLKKLNYIKYIPFYREVSRFLWIRRYTCHIFLTCTK